MNALPWLLSLFLFSTAYGAGGNETSLSPLTEKMVALEGIFHEEHKKFSSKKISNAQYEDKLRKELLPAIDELILEIDAIVAKGGREGEDALEYRKILGGFRLEVADSLRSEWPRGKMENRPRNRSANDYSYQLGKPITSDSTALAVAEVNPVASGISTTSKPSMPRPIENKPGVSPSIAPPAPPKAEKSTVKFPDGKIFHFQREKDEILLQACRESSGECREARVPYHVFAAEVKAMVEIPTFEEVVAHFPRAPERELYEKARHQKMVQLSAGGGDLKARLALRRVLALHGLEKTDTVGHVVRQAWINQVEKSLASDNSSEDALLRNSLNALRVLSGKEVDGLLPPGKSDEGRMQKLADLRAEGWRVRTLFARFDPTLEECGKTPATKPGDKSKKFTINDRTKDCALRPSASVMGKNGSVWMLVTRVKDPATMKFFSVWQDGNTGLLWGERLEQAYTHPSALTPAGKKSLPLEVACQSKEAEWPHALLAKEVKFRLPTAKELEAASSNGMEEALTAAKDQAFWSSSIVEGLPDLAWAHAPGANLGVIARRMQASVRCVGSGE